MRLRSLRLSSGGLGPIGSRLIAELAINDPTDRLALCYRIAFAHGECGQDAGNARQHLRLIDRGDLSADILPVHGVTCHQREVRTGGSLFRLRGLLATTAARQRQAQRGQTKRRSSQQLSTHRRIPNFCIHHSGVILVVGLQLSLDRKACRLPCAEPACEVRVGRGLRDPALVEREP